MTIDKERYEMLMTGSELLTDDEIKQGWHFCHNFDFLLISPKSKEFELCTCEED